MNLNQTDFFASLPASHPAHDRSKILEGLRVARQMAKNAHVPDTKFHVGSAILTKDGQSFGGCNAETGAYEGETCGERNAIFNLATHGGMLNDPRILDLVTVSCVDMPVPVHIHDGSPCGACRQVMNEFAHKDTVVLIDDKKDGVLIRLSDLLPSAFRFGPEYDSGKPVITPVSVEEIEKDAIRNSSPENLVRLAKEIACNSYIPHSNRRAGAVIVTKDGQAFAGVRVENSSTGLSVNADRVAICRAVIQGSAVRDSRFVSAIAVAQIDPVVNKRMALARLINAELMLEFATSATKIALSNSEGDVQLTAGKLYGDVALSKSFNL